MKYLLVIGDGMADESQPELGGKTPIQYAKTPAMDSLCSAGMIGSALTVPIGMQAGSDVAILSIFGYDPCKFLSGRAPLEAAAMDIKLNPGDIAYRCNIVSFEDKDVPFYDKKILSHSGGSIEGNLSDTLIMDLIKDTGFLKLLNEAEMTIYPGNSFRHIAVQKNAQEDCFAANKAHGVQSLTTYPPHDYIGETLGQYLPKGNEQAELLAKMIQYAHDFLNNHPINLKQREESKLPANGIWFWAEGTATDLPDFKSLYGKTGAVISAVPLCQGIGVMVGLRKILVEGATGELYTNYEGKVQAAVDALADVDFVTVHIEAPDECTHNGDMKGKLQAIEWVDSRVVAPLVEKLKASGVDFRMLVMSDHKTLLSTRGHDGSPVPYIIYDSRINNNSGLKFCEENAEAEKDNYIEPATKLMGILFNG